jgi:hypothetical protein
MKSYTLVNPQLKGSIDVEFKCNSAIEAANLAYDSISKYFSNNVPNFSFTLQKGGAKFFHFNVKEKINNKKDKIKFIIEENSTITNIDGLLKFIKVNDEELEGGQKDDKHDKHAKHSKKYKFDDDDSSSSSNSSDSDSDSDDDYYYYKPITRNMPITYWSYYPHVYNLKKVYVPTFVPTVTPYIYIAYE